MSKDNIKELMNDILEKHEMPNVFMTVNHDCEFKAFHKKEGLLDVHRDKPAPVEIMMMLSRSGKVAELPMEIEIPCSFCGQEVTSSLYIREEESE